MSEYGYIYLHSHESYNEHNIYLLGSTNNIEETELFFIDIGYGNCDYKMIIQVKKYTEKAIERLLQFELKKYHKYFGGGTGFYDREIEKIIIPILESLNIKFEIVSKEVNELLKLNRIKKKFRSITKSIINYANLIKQT